MSDKSSQICQPVTYFTTLSKTKQVYFMYLRAILCTFQISVDFYFVPVSGRGGRERRAGEGEGARERGIECILYRYS